MVQLIQRESRKQIYRIGEEKKKKDSWRKMAELDTKLVNVLQGNKVITFEVILLTGQKSLSVFYKVILNFTESSSNHQ